jgi:hypothetical protein
VRRDRIHQGRAFAQICSLGTSRIMFTAPCRTECTGQRDDAHKIEKPFNARIILDNFCPVLSPGLDANRFFGRVWPNPATAGAPFG